MRTLIHFLIGAALLAPGAVQAKERLAPEAQLAKALDGRVAGEPARCINLRNSDSSQVIPGHAIVYKDGRTLWVNRPRSGARNLTANDVLVTRTLGSQLCSTDTVVMHDRYSQAMTGIVFLGEFVPYRKIETVRLR